jgi:hypothetical protein
MQRVGGGAALAKKDYERMSLTQQRLRKISGATRQ